jgi:cell division protein FtsZ
MDLTIDEVTTIASIIQEASGDDAEIIFGAVHDPTLEGELRCTVIATGLDRVELPPQIENVVRPTFGSRTVTPPAPAEPAYAARTATAGVATAAAPRTPVFPEATPFQRLPTRRLRGSSD